MNARPGRAAFQTGFRTLFLFAALACLPAEAYSQAPPDGGYAWQTYSTLHCVIKYQDEADLERFNDALNFNPTLLGLSPQFNISESDDVTTRLSKKVDSLFERTQVLLDMRRNMPQVVLLVYKDYVQVQSVFNTYFANTPGTAPRSWYVFEYRSVYINLSDLFPGMLAHEMAHHIIDHYLQVRPAAGSAEMLAVFVEKNLFD